MSKPTTTPVLSTLSERVTEELRLAILSGSILPGTKLRVEDLSEKFGYSATPIRESLNRLIASGMVQAIGQRGFRVEPASYDDLAFALRANAGATYCKRKLTAATEIFGDAAHVWEAQ